MKEWHFFDKVYRAWVVLVIGDFDSFKKFMTGTTYKHTDELHDGAGYCIGLNSTNTTNGNDCCVIWLKRFESACLVHELSHLVMMVFDAKGVPIAQDNTESFAYYQEFWFNEIQRTRRKYPNGRSPKEARK